MNAFIVELENRPGTAADVAEAIGSRGINLTSAAGMACGSSGTMVVTSTDEAGTRSVLQSGGYTFRELEIVAATLADSPGALAGVLRKIASAGVNVEALLPMGMNENGIVVGFVTDNAAVTRSALGQATAAR